MAKNKGLPSLPIDGEAEEQVVAIILTEPELMKSTGLTPDDFFGSINKQIFAACGELVTSNVEINIASIHTATSIENRIISQVKGKASPCDMFSHYEDRVKAISLRRKFSAIMIRQGNSILQKDDPHEVIDRAISEINALTYQNSHSRLPIFEEGQIEVGETPIYHITLNMNGEKKPIRCTSKELTSPLEFSRKVLETFHCNPLLPEKEAWRNFLDYMVINSKKVLGVANSKEEEVITWIKEWFAICSEAETKDGLQRGYIIKDGMRYFQITWLKKYINDQRVTGYDSGQIWSYIKDRGAVQRVSIRIESSVIKLWGLPEAFFVEKEDGSFLDI